MEISPGAWSVKHCAPSLLAIWMVQFSDAGTRSDIIDPIKLWGLPSELSKLDFLGNLGHGLAGVYLKFPLHMYGTHELSPQLKWKVELGYDTGRKVNKYTVGLSGISSQKITDIEGSGMYQTFEYPDFSSFYFRSNNFIGVRPVIGFYSKTILAQARMDIGLNGQIQFSAPKLPAVHSLSCGSTCSQTCTAAHHFEADVNFQVKNFAVDLQAALYFKVGWVKLLDADYSKTWTLASSVVNAELARICL